MEIKVLVAKIALSTVTQSVEAFSKMADEATQMKTKASKKDLLNASLIPTIATWSKVNILIGFKV